MSDSSFSSPPRLFPVSANAGTDTTSSSSDVERQREARQAAIARAYRSPPPPPTHLPRRVVTSAGYPNRSGQGPLSPPRTRPISGGGSGLGRHVSPPPPPPPQRNDTVARDCEETGMPRADHFLSEQRKTDILRRVRDIAKQKGAGVSPTGRAGGVGCVRSPVVPVVCSPRPGLLHSPSTSTCGAARTPNNITRPHDAEEPQQEEQEEEEEGGRSALFSGSEAKENQRQGPPPSSHSLTQSSTDIGRLSFEGLPNKAMDTAASATVVSLNAVEEEEVCSRGMEYSGTDLVTTTSTTGAGGGTVNVNLMSLGSDGRIYTGRHHATVRREHVDPYEEDILLPPPPPPPPPHSNSSPHAVVVHHETASRSSDTSTAIISPSGTGNASGSPPFPSLPSSLPLSDPNRHPSAPHAVGEDREASAVGTASSPTTRTTTATRVVDKPLALSADADVDRMLPPHRPGGEMHQTEAGDEEAKMAVRSYNSLSFPSTSAEDLPQSSPSTAVEQFAQQVMLLDQQQQHRMYIPSHPESSLMSTTSGLHTNNNTTSGIWNSTACMMGMGSSPYSGVPSTTSEMLFGGEGRHVSHHMEEGGAQVGRWIAEEDLRQAVELNRLGKGTSGVVMLATVETDLGPQRLAVKIIDSSNEEASLLSREIEIMQRTSGHVNVVRLFGSYHDSTKSEQRIFMEYVEGGTIEDFVKKCDVPRLQTIHVFMQQIVNGVCFLHSNGIVHHDLKAANIMVTKDGVVKLTDFGCSGLLNVDRGGLTQTNGTPFMMAPEVLRGEKASTASDIWAVGCLGIEMLDRHIWLFPPKVNNYHILYALRETKTPPDGLPTAEMIDALEDLNEGERSVAHAFLDFMKCCLTVEKEKRPSAEELRRHPFITGLVDGVPKGSKAWKCRLHFNDAFQRVRAKKE